MTACEVRVRGNDVHVGDALLTGPDRECVGVVATLRPYVGTLLLVLGVGSTSATFTDGTRFTLPAVQWFTVRRLA